MIEHIVLFKVAPTVPRGQADAMIRRLTGLKDRVPGIVSAHGGTNLTDRSQGYTHVLVVRFADRAALDAYLPHAEHQAAVTEAVRPLCQDVLVMDVEV
jgi:hypothetical protein